MLVCACGDSQSGSDVDGAVSANEPDAFVNHCELLEESYGDLGAPTASAALRAADEDEPDGPKVLSIEVPLNADAAPDVVIIELYDEEGPFQGGYQPGMYSLLGRQADLFECSTCVYIAADRVDGGDRNFHMASSGTLTLESIDATPGTGTVSGSLASVAFRTVTIDGSGQVDTPMGCRTSIEALSFTASVAAGE